MLEYSPGVLFKGSTFLLYLLYPTAIGDKDKFVLFTVESMPDFNIDVSATAILEYAQHKFVSP